MVSEQQASNELIVRNWKISHFEELDRIDAALKKLGISPDQVSQLIEATNELKDGDFRASAFDLLELRERTGKSSKEAAAYMRQLDSQIAAKEKQNSDWTGRIEKTKGEFRGCDQKRNEERARFESEQAQNKCILKEDGEKRNDERIKFESEQAQNKRILKEDGEKLNLELSKNDEIRENIEGIISLKAELEKINMGLPMFKAIVKEIVLKRGISPHIAKNIKAAVKTFGSLGKAIVERAREEKARERAICSLSREEESRKETLQGLGERETALSEDIMKQEKIKKLQRTEILISDEMIQRKKWQWEFFQLFISMLLASPSADDSLGAVAEMLNKLEEKGWKHYEGVTLPEQRRALFIFFVMGTYLRSIHCGNRNCGASFIVNKAPDAYSSYRRNYYCPVCNSGLYTKADATFLNLMASPELAKKLEDARTLLESD